MTPNPLTGQALSPAGNNRLVGYIRVSTDEQNTDLQWDALRKAGADPIFEDRITGVSHCREGLDRALAAVKSGDRLAVWRLDRLGRSIPHVMTIIEELTERGASLVSLTEGLDSGTEAGELHCTVLAMIAHVERRMIQSRTRAGLQAAKARGVRLGPKPKMTAEQVDEARSLMATGMMNASAIGERYDISRATLFRYLRNARLPSLAA